MLFILAAGCAGETPLEPAAADPAQTEAAAGGADRVAVLTRNLYVGADVDAVIAALVLRAEAGAPAVRRCMRG